MDISIAEKMYRNIPKIYGNTLEGYENTRFLKSNGPNGY